MLTMFSNRKFLCVALLLSFTLNIVLFTMLEFNDVTSGLLFHKTSTTTQSPKRALSHSVTFPSVRRMKWDYNDPSFISNIISRGEPVILQDTPSNVWPAYSLWTYTYFIGKIGRDTEIPDVWYTPNPVIYRSSDQYYWPGAVQKYDHVKMTVEQFFNILKITDIYGYHYLSGDVSEEDALFSSLTEDINAQDVIPPDAIPSTLDQNLWIGSPGVTSQCHYDFSQNLYVQYRGQKQMILIPPHNMSVLRPFPYAHPLGRRSQINFTALNEEGAGRLAEQGVQEANLVRGDVLYIPSLWGHHVTNLDGAISLNLWWRTPLQLSLLSNLNDVSSDPRASLALSVQFLRATLIALFGELRRSGSRGSELREWMREHYVLRYERLFREDLKGEESEVMLGACAVPLVPLAEESNQVKLLEVEVNRFLSLWKQVPHNIRELHLGDYVDCLVYANLKPPLNLYFVKYC